MSQTEGVGVDGPLRGVLSPSPTSPAVPSIGTDRDPFPRPWDRAIVLITDLNGERGNAVGVESGIPFLHQDVSSEVDWERVVSGVERRRGALHVPVNNAGTQGHPETPKGPENAPLAH
ncbi:MAG: hypothetical protein EA421_07680 [Gemmatimonadales bacterium]|nr:MAG: hypothetical protein EA421_07680 [Gemmatimonadales bacterium]